jgi:hypothetical protein
MATSILTLICVPSSRTCTRMGKLAQGGRGRQPSRAGLRWLRLWNSCEMSRRVLFCGMLAACLVLALLGLFGREWRFSWFHNAAQVERLWRARFVRRAVGKRFLQHLRQRGDAAPDSVSCAVEPVRSGAGVASVQQLREFYRVNPPPKFCVATLSVHRRDPSEQLTQTVGIGLAHAEEGIDTWSHWDRIAKRVSPGASQRLWSCGSRVWEENRREPLAHWIVLNMDPHGHPEAESLSQVVTVVDSSHVMEDPLVTRMLDQRWQEYEKCSSAFSRWHSLVQNSSDSFVSGSSLRGVGGTEALVELGRGAGLDPLVLEDSPLLGVPGIPSVCSPFAAMALRRDVLAQGERASRRIPWREWPRVHRRHAKASLDYALALDVCANSIGAEYAVLLEDDALLAKGWLAKIERAILPLAKAVTRSGPNAPPPSTLTGSEAHKYGLDGAVLAAPWTRLDWRAPTTGKTFRELAPGELFVPIEGADVSDGSGQLLSRSARPDSVQASVTWIKLFYPDFLEQWGLVDLTILVGVPLTAMVVTWLLFCASVLVAFCVTSKFLRGVAPGLRTTRHVALRIDVTPRSMIPSFTLVSIFPEDCRDDDDEASDSRASHSHAVHIDRSTRFACVSRPPHSADEWGSCLLSGVVVAALTVMYMFGAGRQAILLSPWQRPGVHPFTEGCCIVGMLYPQASARELSWEIRSHWASEADYSDFSLPFAAEAHHADKLRLIASPHLVQHIGFVTSQPGASVSVFNESDLATQRVQDSALNVSQPPEVTPRLSIHRLWAATPAPTPSTSPYPVRAPNGGHLPEFLSSHLTLDQVPEIGESHLRVEQWAWKYFDHFDWEDLPFLFDFGFSNLFDRPPTGTVEEGDPPTSPV